ncbi:hypothetical protein JVU11DRAFT_5824 [Chiua virens]|nr:hypothetical protein JVU11DRAFT_5824 [Chiua virens]
MDSGIRVIPPQEDSGPSFIEGLYSMFTGGWQGMVDNVVNRNPKFPPLDVLPCANVNIERYAVCENPGKMACGSCKLVSYCSKECQRAHWATHKSDCKDSIRSSNWKPGWIVEGRDPRFLDGHNMSTAEEFASRFQERLSLGVSLWGNVPAMDILNLANNEKDLNTDLSLAFSASGDIRNIVATVNALGVEYSGNLKIILNDLNPFVVARNITLLLILGTIPDEAIAADVALHFWYSVFLPMEYRLRILSMVSPLLQKGNFSVSPDVQRLMMENVGPGMSPDQAQAEYKRVRKAPSRVDFRDRMYMGLKPSHRLAFLEYRRFGVLLPFGALNAHCNVPNPSLFANGMWLQTDYADPLESWDIDQVFSAGKAHGAQPEDVYWMPLLLPVGPITSIFPPHTPRSHFVSCFQLRSLCTRGGHFQGKFATYGIPSTTRFDRIDVSNIMDANYVGIRGVMDAWGPLLAKTDHAALTGYFMNWTAFAEKGTCCGCWSVDTRSHNGLDEEKQSPFLAMDDIDAFYDNWKAFSKFWKSQGGAGGKLHLRTAHKIVPHRLKTAVDAKPDALPKFADDETCKLELSLASSSAEHEFVTLIKSHDPLGVFAPSELRYLARTSARMPELYLVPAAKWCHTVHSGDIIEKSDEWQIVVFSQVLRLRDHEHASSQAPTQTDEIRETVISLSGNPPAVDIVNLKDNERDKTRDLSLAFVASGDLRSVIRTINALGSDYTGRLHILLNDASKPIVSRNIVLLLILGTMSNESVAADIALHFWYSVFLPEEYRLRVLALLALILQQCAENTEPLSVRLGRRARLTCLVPPEITDHLLYTAGPTLSASRARDEYERVYATPARLDARNRALAGVNPCHSLAFMAFWRSGIVLPLSVSSDHHTAPNPSLFSPYCPNEVIKSGRTHGAQSEDIYGCLYFFLADQLQTFAKRIRELEVTFYVFNTEAHTLARDISGGQYSRHGLTPSVRFNRIDLGHALADSDPTRDVLTSWTPLLAQGDTATILGVFSDWSNTQKDGSVIGADETVVARIVDKLHKLGRLPPKITVVDVVATETPQLDAAYDNSKAFSRYMKTSGLSNILREAMLKRRPKHKILPQRVRMPIDAKSSDLPHLPDDGMWYRYMTLAKVTFTTRYVEFARSTAT